MRRKVWLEGDQYYLQPLPDRLHYGDTVIQREGSEYVLVSTEIDAAPDDHEANAIAAKLIRHINAIGRIHDPNFRPMKLGRYTDETGQSVITGVMHTTLPALRSGDAGYPFGAPDYLALAESNSHVCRVLSIFARNDELDWYDLYKVHEIIRRDVEPQKLDQLGWTTKAEDSAFTVSANRYDVSGDAARHAVDNGEDPPKRTMSLREGCKYISSLTARWLDSLSGKTSAP